jgi:hypothetical protein
MGEASDIDVVILNKNLKKNDKFYKTRLQAKSRKTVPKYFELGNANIKTMRENGNKNFKAIVDYDWLMECLSRVH